MKRGVHYQQFLRTREGHCPTPLSQGRWQRGALYLEDFFLHLQRLRVPLRYQAGKSTHSSCPDRDLGVVG